MGDTVSTSGMAVQPSSTSTATCPGKKAEDQPYGDITLHCGCSLPKVLQMTEQEFLCPGARELLYGKGSPRLQDIPRLLQVAVPRGPTWTSGLYVLVEELANCLPLWKATHQELWIYALSPGSWGICGRHEFEQAFQTKSAFVFCESRSGRHAMPHEVAGGWMHDRPAWTLDSHITVESWPETVKMQMQKVSWQEKFGMQTLIVNPDVGLMEFRAGEEAPAVVDPRRRALTDAGRGIEQGGVQLANTNGHEGGEAASQEGGDERQAAVGSARGGTGAMAPWVLRVYDISEGSLLARWNAQARKADVVRIGSDIVRVGFDTNPFEMQEALLNELCVNVEFKRPELRVTTCTYQQNSREEALPLGARGVPNKMKEVRNKTLVAIEEVELEDLAAEKTPARQPSDCSTDSPSSTSSRMTLNN